MLNLPNILTLSRLFLIPVFVYAAIASNFAYHWLAPLSFGLAAFTDWLDGQAARRLNQVTEFGKVADPVVDRILIASALVTLYIKISTLVPLWAILIVVGRDILMVIGWVYISYLGTRIRVTYEGKLATATLMGAVFFLTLNFGDGSAQLKTIGILLFYIGVALSLLSGLKYLKLAVSILRGIKTT